MTLESLIQSRDGSDCKPDPQTTPEDLRLSKVQVRVRMNMLKAELLLLEAEAKKLSVVQSNSVTQRTMHIEYAEECYGRLSAMSAGAHSECAPSMLCGCVHACVPGVMTQSFGGQTTRHVYIELQPHLKIWIERWCFRWQLQYVLPLLER